MDTKQINETYFSVYVNTWRCSLFNLECDSFSFYEYRNFGHMIIYFTIVCLFYLKSLCLMSALVKIPFYYYKQHLRSDFNFKIYIYFILDVYFFSRRLYLFRLYLFSVSIKSIEVHCNPIFFHKISSPFLKL